MREKREGGFLTAARRPASVRTSVCVSGRAAAAAGVPDRAQSAHARRDPRGAPFRRSGAGCGGKAGRGVSGGGGSAAARLRGAGEAGAACARVRGLAAGGPAFFSSRE